MLKALTVTLALISCLPAWGQPPKPTTGETDSSNRPGTSNTCADATYAANHPDACHPQPPPTPSSGSTSSKKPNPCTNQTYAAAHPYDAATGGGCKQAKPGTSPVSGPTLGCSGNLNPDAGCGPNNGNPPTYPNGVQVSGTLDCAGGNCDNSGSEDNSGSASDGGGVGGAVVGNPPESSKHINVVSHGTKQAAARCKDGFYTTTTDRNLACSKHGGIADWLLK
jgi:hypothetical protein